MTDVFSPAQRSTVMRAVRGRDTGPEMRVRRALHAAGFRFRLQRADLPGKPDLVLPRHRLAVFVHGCFWHGHDCARGRRMPKTNAAYWQAKIARNKARDATVQAALCAAGWTPVIIWECALDGAVARVQAAIARA